MASIRKYKKKGDKKYSYEYRIRYKDPITQAFKEKSKRGFKSEKEAIHAAVEEEKRLAEGFEETDVSLKTFLKTWLEEYKKDDIRKNTYILHERNIQKHIVPYFKNILLKQVKPVMYQKFINHLTKQGYSKRTVQIVHGTMFSCCEKAAILGKIEKNPCEGVTIKGQIKEDDIKFIESEDIPTFLKEAYAYEYNYWIYFKTLIETGMRKGEAAALQWPDIDLKNLTITINKTLDFQAKDKSELFGDTKTYNSNRTISISQSLANDLRFHLTYQNQNKVTLNDRYHHDLNLVFCRKDGNFLPKSTLFNAFSRILKRADIPSLPIHSLRHTHAVLLLEAGADMKFVQERLGHGSLQITSDVYAHISKKIEASAMDKFENYTKNLLN